jgi:hypothetical protein
MYGTLCEYNLFYFFTVQCLMTSTSCECTEHWGWQPYSTFYSVWWRVPAVGVRNSVWLSLFYFLQCVMTSTICGCTELYVTIPYSTFYNVWWRVPSVGVRNSMWLHPIILLYSVWWRVPSVGLRNLCDYPYSTLQCVMTSTSCGCTEPWWWLPFITGSVLPATCSWIWPAGHTSSPSIEEYA